MLKKLTIATTLFALTACNSQMLSGQSNMAYKISDKEMERYYSVQKGLLRCLHPNLRQIDNDQKKINAFLKSLGKRDPRWDYTVVEAAIAYSIPQDILYIINSDPASEKYFWETQVRLFPITTSIQAFELSTQQCNQFKADFYKRLEHNKKFMKKENFEVQKEIKND